MLVVDGLRSGVVFLLSMILVVAPWGLKSLRENSPCPVPLGMIASGDLRSFLPPQSGNFFSVIQNSWCGGNGQHPQQMGSPRIPMN